MVYVQGSMTIPRYEARGVATQFAQVQVNSYSYYFINTRGDKVRGCRARQGGRAQGSFADRLTPVSTAVDSITLLVLRTPMMSVFIDSSPRHKYSLFYPSSIPIQIIHLQGDERVNVWTN